MRSPFKIVHLSYGGSGSGAAKGALTLHQGLVSLGEESQILSSFHQEVSRSSGKYKYYLQELLSYERVKKRIDYELKRDFSGSHKLMYSSGCLGSLDITNRLIQNADIIHLHWVNSGFLSLKNIGALGGLNKPIVWSLRDMWPFTGGCHYSIGCERYSSGCGCCPLFPPTSKWDRTRLQYKDKVRRFGKIKRFFPVGISPWIAREASRSQVFRGKKVEMIWNGVDLNQFPYLNKLSAKESLKLNPNFVYLSIGSVDLRYPYKGYFLLHQALVDLSQMRVGRDIRLLVFGRGGEELIELFPGSIHYGFVDESRLLNSIYAASDTFLFPSIQEAFGKTIVEALSSGCPVICYPTSGPKDIVRHKETGYIADGFTSDSFVKGIKWVLKKSSKNSHGGDDSLRKLCSNSAEEYGYLRTASAYVKLYEKIIQG